MNSHLSEEGKGGNSGDDTSRDGGTDSRATRDTDVEGSASRGVQGVLVGEEDSEAGELLILNVATEDGNLLGGDGGEDLSVDGLELLGGDLLGGLGGELRHGLLGDDSLEGLGGEGTNLGGREEVEAGRLLGKVSSGHLGEEGLLGLDGDVGELGLGDISQAEVSSLLGGDGSEGLLAEKGVFLLVELLEDGKVGDGVSGHGSLDGGRELVEGLLGDLSGELGVDGGEELGGELVPHLGPDSGLLGLGGLILVLLVLLLLLDLEVIDGAEDVLHTGVELGVLLELLEGLGVLKVHGLDDLAGEVGVEGLDLLDGVNVHTSARMGIDINVLVSTELLDHLLVLSVLEDLKTRGILVFPSLGLILGDASEGISGELLVVDDDVGLDVSGELDEALGGHLDVGDISELGAGLDELAALLLIEDLVPLLDGELAGLLGGCLIGNTTKELGTLEVLHVLLGDLGEVKLSMVALLDGTELLGGPELTIGRVGGVLDLAEEVLWETLDDVLVEGSGDTLEDVVEELDGAGSSVLGDLALVVAEGLDKLVHELNSEDRVESTLGGLANVVGELIDGHHAEEVNLGSRGTIVELIIESINEVTVLEVLGRDVMELEDGSRVCMDDVNDIVIGQLVGLLLLELGEGSDNIILISNIIESLLDGSGGLQGLNFSNGEGKGSTEDQGGGEEVQLHGR